MAASTVFNTTITFPKIWNDKAFPDFHVRIELLSMRVCLATVCFRKFSIGEPGKPFWDIKKIAKDR